MGILWKPLLEIYTHLPLFRYLRLRDYNKYFMAVCKGNEFGVYGDLSYLILKSPVVSLSLATPTIINILTSI